MGKEEKIRQPYHISALLEESVKLLNIRPEGIYVDVTFGGGGHSRAIMKKLGDAGRLLGFDRDMEAYVNNIEDERFTFVHGNFRYLENFLRFYEVDKVDGIIADFGVSFHHFDTPDRGFSFRYDSPLDMRMNREAELNGADLLNMADEAGLKRLFQNYADLKRPGNVARSLYEAKLKEPITTTIQLADAVRGALDPRQEKKEMAQVFQAIRIAVNHEDEDLALFLQSTEKVLKPGGRLVTLTYHSMEDRMVKNFMKTGNLSGEEIKDFFGKVETPWKLITRKPIEASKKEVEENPRSRSARLRAAEYIGK